MAVMNAMEDESEAADIDVATARMLASMRQAITKAVVVWDEEDSLRPSNILNKILAPMSAPFTQKITSPFKGKFNGKKGGAVAPENSTRLKMSRAEIDTIHHVIDCSLAQTEINILQLHQFGVLLVKHPQLAQMATELIPLGVFAKIPKILHRLLAHPAVEKYLVFVKTLLVFNPELLLLADAEERGCLPCDRIVHWSDITHFKNSLLTHFVNLSHGFNKLDALFSRQGDLGEYYPIFTSYASESEEELIVRAVSYGLFATETELATKFYDFSKTIVTNNKAVSPRQQRLEHPVVILFACLSRLEDTTSEAEAVFHTHTFDLIMVALQRRVTAARSEHSLAYSEAYSMVWNSVPQSAEDGSGVGMLPFVNTPSKSHVSVVVLERQQYVLLELHKHWGNDVTDEHVAGMTPRIQTFTPGRSLSRDEDDLGEDDDDLSVTPIAPLAPLVPRDDPFYSSHSTRGDSPVRTGLVSPLSPRSELSRVQSFQMAMSALKARMYDWQRDNQSNSADVAANSSDDTGSEAVPSIKPEFSLTDAEFSDIILRSYHTQSGASVAGISNAVAPVGRAVGLSASSTAVANSPAAAAVPVGSSMRKVKSFQVAWKTLQHRISRSDLACADQHSVSAGSGTIEEENEGDEEEEQELTLAEFESIVFEIQQFMTASSTGSAAPSLSTAESAGEPMSPTSSHRAAVELARIETLDKQQFFAHQDVGAVATPLSPASHRRAVDLARIETLDRQQFFAHQDGGASDTLEMSGSDYSAASALSPKSAAAKKAVELARFDTQDQRFFDIATEGPDEY